MNLAHSVYMHLYSYFYAAFATLMKVNNVFQLLFAMSAVNIKLIKEVFLLTNQYVSIFLMLIQLKL